MARLPDTVLLEVRDEGKGISPEKLVDIRSQGSGVGIQGMRERVRQFRGQMEVASSGAGTKISVILPTPASDPSRDQALTRPLPTAT